VCTDLADREEPLYIYRISYMWYTLIGVATAITVGMVVSFLTNPNRAEDVDSDLLTPVIHRFLPSKAKHIELHTQKQVSYVNFTFIYLSDLKLVILVKCEAYPMISSWVDRLISWVKIYAKEVLFSLVWLFGNGTSLLCNTV
jgi:hypothetical protein